MTKDLKPPLAQSAQHMTFSPETALAYARALARPRRAGSGEDEAVAREIAQRLEQCGWTVERQSFRFSNLVNVVIALEVLACLLLAAAAEWAGAIPAWIPAILILVVLMLTNGIVRAAQTRAVVLGVEARRPARLLPQFATANLIATPPHSPENPSAPHLYLVAHYDSKSQFMPIVVRITLFVAAIGGSVSFAGLTLAGLLLPALLPAAHLAGMLAIITALPLAVLLLVKAGNASPGAIDNASGVGTVLHLAECLTTRPTHSANPEQAPDNRIGVTLLITSAEEFGLLGAAAYLKQNASRLRQHTRSGGLTILNFDGVGVDGSLYYTDAPARSPGRLVNLLREACGELGIPVRKYSLPGALFDHMPFAQRGFDAVSLTAIGRATRFVHTPGDSADKLDARGFEQAGRVALRVIEKLAGQGTQGTAGTEGNQPIDL